VVTAGSDQDLQGILEALESLGLAFMKVFYHIHRLRSRTILRNLPGSRKYLPARLPKWQTLGPRKGAEAPLP